MNSHISYTPRSHNDNKFYLLLFHSGEWGCAFSQVNGRGGGGGIPSSRLLLLSLSGSGGGTGMVWGVPVVVGGLEAALLLL